MRDQYPRNSIPVTLNPKNRFRGNDRRINVFIFAGGEMPFDFLGRIGITMQQQKLS